jgi:tetratricopeptide (TPR) repeat protein
MTAEEDGIAPDRGAASATGSGDALAAVLAADAAKNDPAMASRVARVLDEQARLLRLQAEELETESAINHRSLRIRHFNELMKAAFSVSVAAVALVVAIGFGAIIWEASNARGLVVEPIRVPADIASRGTDGTTLSQMLLEKLNGLTEQAAKIAFVAGEPVNASWGNDTKVEIPETGVSISELSRELRSRLGHETLIGGELIKTPGGLALYVRADRGTTVVATGSEDDLSGLLDNAALALLKQTQPSLYGSLYLLTDTRKAETFLQAALTTTSGRDRDGVIAELATARSLLGDDQGALSIITQANFANAPFVELALANAQFALGHTQPAFEAVTKQAERIRHGATTDVGPAAAAYLPLLPPLWLHEMTGDFRGAYEDGLQLQVVPAWNFDEIGWRETASDATRDHDLNAAETILTKHPESAIGEEITNALSVNYVLPVHFAVLAEREEWSEAVRAMREGDAASAKAGTVDNVRHTMVWPWLAYALAKSGDLRAAQELILRTPKDCLLCLEMRGRVEEIAGNYENAAKWFGLAVKNAPSIPFAATDWGAMLLHRGDYDGAISWFQQAHKIGPNFADPLEMWGEALMQKNRSDLAREKFAEANKHAPNWGRLHLEWGKALWWSGDKRGARQQFAIASGLGMSAADKDVLVRVTSWR